MIYWVVALFSLSWANPPTGGDTCDLAQAELDAFLGAQTRDCRTADDCEAYHYRVHDCAKPVVLAKKVVEKEFEDKLAANQKKVREACAARWANHNPCSPQTATPVCNHGRCRDREDKN